MTAAFTIAKKDFKVLLTSPMFFFLTGLFTLIWSFNYIQQIGMFAAQSMMGGNPMGGGPNQNIQQAVVVPLLSVAHMIFLFLAPALTMRLLAEEKKMSTYDLLLTAPISAADIAVGKFLAAFGTAMIILAISFAYPLGTMFFAEVPLGPLLSSYLGMALLIGFYVAIGLFASSLTSSLILALILGFVFNLMTWFISQGADLSNNQIYIAVLEHMSIGEHIESFIMGSIKTSSLVFLLSCICLFVFLTERVVESSRWR